MTAKNKSMTRLFRPEALDFPRYSLNESYVGVRLHQNESLDLSTEEREEFAEVLASSARMADKINTYPSLEPGRLLHAYARTLDVPVENIEVTAGSSQALTLLAEALFAPGRRIALTSPSFSLYAHLASLYGSEVEGIELDSEFEFAENTLFKNDIFNSHVALLCTPNNPTGTLCSRELILRFADRYQGMLIVDEAYVEFATDSERQSFVNEAIKRENVVVLRTLSKAWGAAGLRVGTMVSHTDNIALFRALKPPYSIPTPSEVLATYILERKGAATKSRVAESVDMRNRLQSVLRDCSQVKALTNSEANFVFFKSPRAAELEKILGENGFLVRRYSTGRLENAIRISMPPRAQFNSLKNILHEVLK